MRSTYCTDFETVRERFDGWWNHRDIGRPLMRITASGRKGKTVPIAYPDDCEKLYLDAKYINDSYRNFCETHFFLADAYPNISADLGPGSMALYLGGEPEFSNDTVWFKETIEDSLQFRKLSYDPDNQWWRRHIQLIKEIQILSEDEYMVNIPDIVENLDILSALRGSMNFCYDLIDRFEDVEIGVKKIDELYFRYYDAFYEIVKQPNGCSSFTAFSVLGNGRIAKIQCDFCTLISPETFRKLVLPSLKNQCRSLDYTLFHLDGPGAIKHLDALMEIDELDALQWTSGEGQPDGGNEKWFHIYDKVMDAGKSLWIMIADGTPEDWAEKAKNIIKRYGRKGLYFLFPNFEDPETANRFIECFK